MKTKEKVVKEEVKPPVVVKYTMKAVIPTGPYANIQPEITVEAMTLDAAHELIMPYIDGLFESYLNASDRTRPKVTMVVTEKKVEAPRNIGDSEPCKRARQAIGTCYSLEALDLVTEKIANSVKLTALEKLSLKAPLAARHSTLMANERKNTEYNNPEEDDTNTPTTTEEVSELEPT